VNAEIDQIARWGLNDRRMSDLRDAVHLWTSSGAEVVLVHMPYPQPVWDAMQEQSDIVRAERDLDAFLQDLSVPPGVALCDLSDPSTTGLTDNAYWWDGGHYTAAAADIIFAHVESCAAEQFGESEES
jgi:hypothetical protein